MGLLSDAAIRARVKLAQDNPNRLRISGFKSKLVKPAGKPSHGTSCYGYDMRLADEFCYIDPVALAQSETPYLEPGKPAPWTRVRRKQFIIRPGEFLMARTMEYVRIPRDCGAVVFGKSTWARLAICLNTTLLEPEWEGTITLEISNIGNFPVMLTAGAGICQVVFSTSDALFRIVESYADRKAPTYQRQRAVTLSKV